MMKPLIKATLPLLATLLLAAAAKGGVTIDLDAGHLYSSGTTSAYYLPYSTTSGSTGALLQIIASTNGSFSNPTPGSYTGGNANNYVVADLSMNNAGTDEDFSEFSFTFGTDLNAEFPNLASGDALLLRWFPSITLAQEEQGTTPSVGTAFGYFEGNAADDNAWGLPAALPWVIPSDGSNDTGNDGLYFLTDASGGTLPETAGKASSTVTAVPEPAEFAELAGVLVVGAMFLGRRR
jgi:hypothetical protein